jgi:hypothetical protein
VIDPADDLRSLEIPQWMFGKRSIFHALAWIAQVW